MSTRWKCVLAYMYLHIYLRTLRVHTYPRAAASPTACRTHVMSHRKRESLPLRNAGHAAPAHGRLLRMCACEKVAWPGQTLTLRTVRAYMRIHTRSQAYAHAASDSLNPFRRSIWSLNNFHRRVITMYFS